MGKEEILNNQYTMHVLDQGIHVLQHDQRKIIENQLSISGYLTGHDFIHLSNQSYLNIGIRPEKPPNIIVS